MDPRVLQWVIARRGDPLTAVGAMVPAPQREAPPLPTEQYGPPEAPPLEPTPGDTSRLGFDLDALYSEAHKPPPAPPQPQVSPLAALMARYRQTFNPEALAAAQHRDR